MTKSTRKRLNLPHRNSSLNNSGSESATNGATEKEPVMQLLSDAALNQINTEKQIQQLWKELEEHKKAIKFLLSTNKQFQDEIQKKEIKKET